MHILRYLPVGPTCLSFFYIKSDGKILVNIEIIEKSQKISGFLLLTW